LKKYVNGKAGERSGIDFSLFLGFWQLSPLARLAWTGSNHRNIKTRRKIKPWKVKKTGGGSDQGVSAPKQYIYRILCHGKFNL
jgi:cytochrome oxidase assembly protein ShyY1